MVCGVCRAGLRAILGHLRAIWDPFGVMLGYLGPNMRYLVAVLGQLGSILGHLDANFYPGRLGASLAPSWSQDGPSWRRVGLSWRQLRPSLGRREHLLALLGPFLVPSWRRLGPPSGS